MKTQLKVAVVGIGASVLLLVGALLVAPFFLKDHVIELVRRQINERLDATVTFEDVDLTLLSSFPTLTIEVVGVEVAGAGEFEGVTLASVQSFRAGVDFIRLVRDEQLLIESAAVDQPEIRLIVNEDEEANYDIVKAADGEEETEAEDEPATLQLRIHRVQITGGRIEYEAPGTEVSLVGLAHEGSASIEGAKYSGSSRTTVESLTVRIGDVRYIRKAKASLDLGSVLHTDDERLDVERLEVALNASVFDRDEAFRLLDKNGAGSYLFDLGQPYGWLAYLSPLWMLLALPQLAANLLNIHGLAANPFAHYVSVPLVALTLGLIATFANRPGVLLRSVMAVWLLLLAFNTSVSRGYMPYSDNYRSGVWQLFENDRSRELRGAIEVVPDEAAVVATYNLSPQLARRDEVYMWPNPYRREYWGAGDAPALPDPGFVEYLALDRSTMGEESREFADEVIAVWGFETVYENGPVSVLRRPPDGDG